MQICFYENDGGTAGRGFPANQSKSGDGGNFPQTTNARLCYLRPQRDCLDAGSQRTEPPASYQAPWYNPYSEPDKCSAGEGGGGRRPCQDQTIFWTLMCGWRLLLRPMSIMRAHSSTGISKL